MYGALEADIFMDQVVGKCVHKILQDDLTLAVRKGSRRKCLMVSKSGDSANISINHVNQQAKAKIYVKITRDAVHCIQIRHIVCYLCCLHAFT